MAKSTLDSSSHRTPLRASMQLSHHQSTTSTGDGMHRNSSVFEDKEATKNEDLEKQEEEYSPAQENQ